MKTQCTRPIPIAARRCPECTAQITPFGVRLRQALRLVHVDFATQARTVKASGRRYAEIIRWT